MRKLEDEWGQTKRHPLFAPGHFTIHPGVIVAGTKGVLVPFFVSEFMTIEYCCWYHPDEDPDGGASARSRRTLRERPRSTRGCESTRRSIEWKLNWPAFSVDEDHPISRGASATRTNARWSGTRFAGRPLVRGFAAVEDCSFLNIGGIPTVSYGPGDLRVAHADDEHILIDELVAAAKTYALLAMDWCGT